MSQEMNSAIDTVLGLAAERGLNLDLLAVERKSTQIGFQKRKVETFSFSETRQLGVRVFDGQHEGVAYTENITPESLSLMVEDALANAKMIRHEWISRLPGATAFAPMNGLADAGLESVTPEQKIAAARDLEAAALDYDKRIAGVAMTRYGDNTSQVWVANSHGLRGSYKTSSVLGFSECLAEDTAGNVMGKEWSVYRRFNELNAAEVGRIAAEKTLSRLGATRPATGRYTVVFDSRIAQRLFGLIAEYFSAKAVDERTSPLAGKIGQKVFSPQLTVTDDPFSPVGSGSRPFDEEGYASVKTSLVENGVLRSYLTNSVMADKLKLPHTANASRSPSSELDVSCSNLVVQPGPHTLEQLTAADKKVVFITDLLGYSGFRATSGDFSMPAEGYLYENGKRAGALKDFLISGNILQVFSTVEAVGQEAAPPTGNTICPALLIRDLNISGQS